MKGHCRVLKTVRAVQKLKELHQSLKHREGRKEGGGRRPLMEGLKSF